MPISDHESYSVPGQSGVDSCVPCTCSRGKTLAWAIELVSCACQLFFSESRLEAAEALASGSTTSTYPGPAATQGSEVEGIRSITYKSSTSSIQGCFQRSIRSQVNDYSKKTHFFRPIMASFFSVNGCGMCIHGRIVASHSIRCVI